MRRRLQERREPKKTKISFKKIILPVLFILFVGGILYFILGRTWDGKSKLSIAVAKSDGSASVIIIDPPSGTLTTINIPGDTMVTASHNLGNWKLKSIWKLGENEKLGPNFFKTTIVKSFSFPIVAWADETFSNTNLSLVDRLQISWFTLFIKNTAKTEIQLEDTDFIKKSKSKDGTMSWVIGDNVPLSITPLFVNHDLENLNVEIIKPNGTSAKEVNDVLSTLGIKVAVITTSDTSGTKDCEIITENQTAGTNLSRVFSCAFKRTSTNDNFDVKIVLSKNFNQLF